MMKLYYFYTLEALRDGQGKIKMHYGMSRVKKQLSGKRPISSETKSKKIRVNGVTDRNEKYNMESESQRGVVINKTTRKNKNGCIGRCLPLILKM